MVRRFWPGWMVLLLTWGAPAVGVAQQEETPQVAEEGEIEANNGGDDEGMQDAEPVQSEQASAASEIVEEPALIEGPGGQPLRTDYPGTEESLQARMATSRIEGAEGFERDEPAEVYDLRVRELETEIDDLKERVFRSKSRIVLLKETVLAENLAGSRAIVTFEDKLGSGYELHRAIFSVDGSRVFSTGTGEEFRRNSTVEIFNGPMAPGTHTISASLGLRASGYGIFSYAKGYQFDLRFSCQFTAEEGRTTLVTVRSYKSGNVFSAHEDRPDGICHVSMVELSVDDLDGED